MDGWGAEQDTGVTQTLGCCWDDTATVWLGTGGGDASCWLGLAVGREHRPGGAEQVFKSGGFKRGSRVILVW